MEAPGMEAAGMETGLATVLRRARLAAGFSQREMARRAGLSAGYVSRLEGAEWERGGPLPSDRALRAIARVTGVSSTGLVRRRDAIRARMRPPDRPQRGGWARANGRMPYAVTVGEAEVAGEAARLVARNPEGAAVRTTRSSLPVTGGGTAYRVRPRAAPGVRALGGHGTSPDAPAALEVVVGEVEAIIVVPGPAGRARAAVTVDDPDLVAALRRWFDDVAWSGDWFDRRAVGAEDWRRGRSSKSLPSVAGSPPAEGIVVDDA